MSHRPVLVVVSLVISLTLVGCAYIPGLSETGLLPGPPITVVARVVPPEQLSSLLSEYGEIGTQACPEGEIYIGTLNIGANTLTLDSCIDIDLATKYAESFGVL